MHHIALRTVDVASLAAFYARWLGLAIVRDGGDRSVWLGLGEGAVLMIEARTPEEPAIDPTSLELLAFAVDTATRTALRARLVAEGRLEGETAHTLYFRDPDGRRLGVSTYPLGG